MAHLSLEGTLKENRSTDGALLGISQALQGLAGSLQKFREVEKMLELESPAEADCSGASDASPKFLGVVGGTVKEMVGKLVSDIEAKPEIQKLLLVIDKSVRGAANEEPAISALAGVILCSWDRCLWHAFKNSEKSTGMQTLLCSSSRGDGPISVDHGTSGVGTACACKATPCRNLGTLFAVRLVHNEKITKFQTRLL